MTDTATATATPATTKPGVTYTCTKCGGKNVLRDAWVEWDETTQEWQVQNVFDEAFCEDCEGTASFNEEPLQAA